MPLTGGKSGDEAELISIEVRRSDVKHSAVCWEYHVGENTMEAMFTSGEVHEELRRSGCWFVPHSDTFKRHRVECG